MPAADVQPAFLSNLASPANPPSPPSPPAAAGFVGAGAGFDLFFFFGAAGLSLLAGVAMLWTPALVLPMWLAWLWLVEGPHLVATYARTYFDPAERHERPRLLLGSLLWFLPGLSALLAARWLGRREIFDLFLGFAALWSWHHGVRQHYGILAIFQRLGRTPRRLQRFDSWLLYALLWGGFGLYLLWQPANRALLGLPATASRPEQVLMLAGATAGALLVVAFAVSILLRWRAGLALRPPLLLSSVLGTGAFGLFVIGKAEPLLPNPQHPEQVFMAATVVGGILHGVAYLGVVFAANRRRYAGPAPAGWAARLGQRPLRAYAVFVLLSLLYMGLTSLRGASPVGSLWRFDSTPAQVFLAVYWGLFFHHYYLDQKIWRVGKSPTLQYELGLRPAPLQSPL